jgi:hypothetical protein
VEYILIYFAFSLTAFLFAIQEERKAGNPPEEYDFGMWVFFIILTIVPGWVCWLVFVGVKKFITNLIKERRWGRGE